jgi:hypothetical protein
MHPRSPVCHLRDAEESFGARFEQILAMDVDPALPGANPDRIADGRQYLRNDVGEALAAFRGRRVETLEVFRKLTPAGNTMCACATAAPASSILPRAGATRPCGALSAALCSAVP